MEEVENFSVRWETLGQNNDEGGTSAGTDHTCLVKETLV